MSEPRDRMREYVDLAESHLRETEAERDEAIELLRNLWRGVREVPDGRLARSIEMFLAGFEVPDADRRAEGTDPR